MPPRRAAATFDALVPAVVLARRPSSSFLRRTHARSRAWIRFSHLAHAHSLIRFHPLSHSPVPRIVSIPPPLPLSIPRPKDQIVRSCEGSEWGGEKKVWFGCFRQRSAVSAGTYRCHAIGSVSPASVLRWSALWKGHRRKDRLAESRWVARFHQHAFASTLLPVYFEPPARRGWWRGVARSHVKSRSMINNARVWNSKCREISETERVRFGNFRKCLKKKKFLIFVEGQGYVVRRIFCRILLFLVFFWRGGRLYSYIDCNEWREKEREVESQLIWDRTLKINYNWSSIEKNCFLNEVAVKLLWNHVNVEDHSSAFPLSSQPLG